MMFVVSYMSPDPITVCMGESVSTAWKLLRRHNILQLPVLDDSARLTGIISDRDVRSAVGYDATLEEKLSVSEVMTANPKTIALEATVDEALGVFFAGRFNAWPVMNGDELKGIITAKDLLRAFHHILGLDREGSRIEIALPNLRIDPADAFKALTAYDGEILSAIVSSMRRDGDEPTLYVRVAEQSGRAVEETLRRAGLIVLVPEHS